ncbi:OLC1v1010316C1 [Oldenlandia corymbosa var. corymbosa]|uniref:OLC1v1010316C1 n=1 Tax=Oldenlandia corymbosa var. corymbosa TaxID=529605 RepID=A0AAV1DRN0_OLDCO|nr:OLC1v1010316C1 [Oldenlandia corymbosa var. corymbosa]
MEMVDWHLSRNKVLLYSCALFITVTIGLHLTLYFQTFFVIINSSSSSLPASPVVDSINHDSCVTWLHDIAFKNKDSNFSYDDSEAWKWVDSNSHVVDCMYKKLSKSEASDLLKGLWIVVIGDSQTRYTMDAFLELLMGPEEIERVRGDFKRHSEYHITLDAIGLNMDFIWAPYVRNLTDWLVQSKKKRYLPDIIIMGAGTWDIIYVNNITDFVVSVKMLNDSVMPLLAVTPESEFRDKPVEIWAPHMFWTGMPTYVHSMLNTKVKREALTNEKCKAYLIHERKLLRNFGGPLFWLDYHSLTGKCGSSCTVDGMHFKVVYQAAVQIMLNVILLESQQRLA